MKKIVIIQYYEERMWVFGVFGTFKQAYENLMQFEDTNVFGENVRQFIKMVRNGESFEIQKKQYIYEDDGSGMIPEDAEYHLTRDTFIVQEVDMSKNYVRSTLGITPWDKV